MGEWDIFKAEGERRTGFNAAGTRFIRWGVKGGFVWRAVLERENFFGDTGYRVAYCDRWHTAIPTFPIGDVSLKEAKMVFRAWVQAHDEEMVARLKKPRKERRSCEASALFAAGRNE